MECTLALVGDGYTLVAADRNAARSIICFKKDEDKVTVLDSHKIMGSSGARPAPRAAAGKGGTTRLPAKPKPKSKSSSRLLILGVVVIVVVAAVNAAREHTAAEIVDNLKRERRWVVGCVLLLGAVVFYFRRQQTRMYPGRGHSLR